MLNLLPIIWMFLQWLLYARESAVLGRSPFWREASGRARETCPGWSEDRKAEAYLLCRFSGVTLVTALQQWLQQLPAWSCWGQCPCNKAVHTGFTSWCFCGAAVLPVPFVLGMPCLGSSWVSCLVTPSLRLCMKIARKSGDLLSHFGRGCWCLGDRHSSYSGVSKGQSAHQLLESLHFWKAVGRRWIRIWLWGPVHSTLVIVHGLWGKGGSVCSEISRDFWSYTDLVFDSLMSCLI